MSKSAWWYVAAVIWLVGIIGGFMWLVDPSGRFALFVLVRAAALLFAIIPPIWFLNQADRSDR